MENNVELISTAKDKAQKMSRMLSDAIEHEKTQAALGWTKRTAVIAADEATRLGKKAAGTEVAKEAAAYAAVGAAVAVPIPLIGPVGGAIVGAGFAVFKSFKKKEVKVDEPSVVVTSAQNFSPVGVSDELFKLAVLRDKGILTEDEYASQKSRLLQSA